LPGFLSIDDAGNVDGWTYFLLHGSELQIGAIDARSEAATAALVDAVLASDEAARAAGVTLFAFASAPGLQDHLARHGFIIERYEYLETSTPRALPAGDDACNDGAHGLWTAVDIGDVAALFRRAYPADAGARPFVRDHSLGAWRDYVLQMIG